MTMNRTPPTCVSGEEGGGRLVTARETPHSLPFGKRVGVGGVKNDGIPPSRSWGEGRVVGARGPMRSHSGKGCWLMATRKDGNALHLALGTREGGDMELKIRCARIWGKGDAR